MRRAPAASVLAIAAACAPPGPARPLAHSPVLAADALDRLRGEWRWALAREVDGVRVVEREAWTFVDDRTADAPDTTAVVGRYVREIEFIAPGGVPFSCNQADRYTLRASYGLEAAWRDGQLRVRELDARAEPSPCEHGLRPLGDYAVALGVATAILTHAGGTQTLLRVGPGPRDLGPLGWRGDAATWEGAWQFTGTTDLDAAHVRDEREAWTLVARPGDRLEGVVDRQLQVRTRDGLPSPCGGPPAWSLRERLRLDGVRVDDRFLLREVEVLSRGVTPPHPCAVGARVLDSAFAELVGDAVVLEWRGKRRQVLQRP